MRVTIYCEHENCTSHFYTGGKTKGEVFYITHDQVRSYAQYHGWTWGHVQGDLCPNHRKRTR